MIPEMMFLFLFDTRGNEYFVGKIPNCLHGQSVYEKIIKQKRTRTTYWGYSCIDGKSFIEKRRKSRPMPLPRPQKKLFPPK